MIILKKIPDKDNKFDFTTVEIHTEGNSLSADELIGVFREFMLDIGYAPKTVKEYLGEE